MNIHKKNGLSGKKVKWKLTCWESCCREASRGLMFVNIGQVLGLLEYVMVLSMQEVELNMESQDLFPVQLSTSSSLLSSSALFLLMPVST